MSEENKMSKDEAIQLLQEEQEERRQECGKRVQEVLDELGCAIVPVVTIMGKEVVSRVDIQVIK